MNRLIILVVDCMRVGICECCVGSDSHVYVDTSGFDKVMEFKLV